MAWKIPLILLILLLPLFAFNNCGQALRGTAGETTSLSGDPTTPGTDAGNPVPHQSGNEILGLTMRACARHQTCTGQVTASCATILLVMGSPGVNAFLGASGSANDLNQIQVAIDNKSLKVDAAKLSSCYQAIETADCALVNMNPAQPGSVILQLNSCANIVGP